MKDVRFQALDGWRGICALLVALYHFDAYSHVYQIPLVRNSWLFVDFFFVLSGFVISHTTLGALDTRAHVVSFVVRRFGRLWPLHASILAFLVAIEAGKLGFQLGGFVCERAAFSENTSLGTILTNVLLIHSLGVHNFLTWNLPSWSISTEFHTYLLFAAVSFLSRGPRNLAIAAIAIVLGSGLILIFFSTKGIDATFDLGLFRCLYGFFIGHLTYRIWQSENLNGSSKGWIVLESTAVILVLILVWTVNISSGFSAPLVFAFTIWVFAHERGPVSRLMNTKPILLLGRWSYSIYMVHIAILTFGWRIDSILVKFLHIGTRTSFQFPWSDEPIQLYTFANLWVMDALTFIYLATVVALASLSYRLIETPGKTYFNALADKAGRTSALA